MCTAGQKPGVAIFVRLDVLKDLNTGMLSVETELEWRRRR